MNRHKGFTLIELLIVIAIIAILTLVRFQGKRASVLIIATRQTLVITDVVKHVNLFKLTANI